MDGDLKLVLKDLESALQDIDCGDEGALALMGAFHALEYIAWKESERSRS